MRTLGDTYWLYSMYTTTVQQLQQESRAAHNTSTARKATLDPNVKVTEKQKPQKPMWKPASR